MANISRKKRNQAPQKIPTPEKKMNDGWYKFMMALAILADILDWTGIGYFLIVVITPAIFIYLRIQKVPINGKKLVTFIATTAAEAIPVISFIPALSISLWLIKKYENSALIQKVASEVSRLKSVKTQA